MFKSCNNMWYALLIVCCIGWSGIQRPNQSMSAPGPTAERAVTSAPAQVYPPGTPPRLEVQLKEVLVLGADASAAAEYLFGLPWYVATDSQGRIYVADLMAMGIKVYTADGDYVRTIGARGKQPGEFQSIKGMYVTDDDELLVFDRENARITRFSADGEVLATYPVPILTSVQMRQLGSHYIALYNEVSRGVGASREHHLFHVYGPTFQEAAAEFGTLNEVADQDQAIVRIYHRSNPGRFVMTGNSTLVYAPGLYDGKLYRYEKRNGQWMQTDILHGYVEEQPYTIVTSSPFDTDHADMVTSVAGMSRPLAALLHNRTRGLFKLQNGRLVHFTFSEFGDERVFGIEVFDEEGNLIGYGPIRAVPLDRNGMATLWWRVAWKDDKGRFYIVDREGDAPVVRVVELEYTLAEGSVN